MAGRVSPLSLPFRPHSTLSPPPPLPLSPLFLQWPLSLTSRDGRVKGWAWQSSTGLYSPTSPTFLLPPRPLHAPHETLSRPLTRVLSSDSPHYGSWSGRCWFMTFTSHYDFSVITTTTWTAIKLFSFFPSPASVLPSVLAPRESERVGERGGRVAFPGGACGCVAPLEGWLRGGRVRGG